MRYHTATVTKSKTSPSTNDKMYESMGYLHCFFTEQTFSKVNVPYICAHKLSLNADFSEFLPRQEIANTKLQPTIVTHIATAAAQDIQTGFRV
jgi:hypothetical protein